MQLPTFSLLHSLLLLLAVSVSASSTATLPATVTLAYAPLTPSTAKPATPKAFATLSYHADNQTYTLHSFTAPKLSSSSSNSIVRIGILPHSRSEPQNDGFTAVSTTIADQKLLAAPETAVIRIVLDTEYAVMSAGVSQDSERKDSKTKKALPRLEVIGSAPEPRPVLNRPVVLGEDGKVPAQDKPEPTLLQRYWWVGALVLVFTFLGGGGEEGGK